MAAKKALSRSAAESVAKLLKWLAENGTRKLKIDELDAIWCYAEKGDTLPETDSRVEHKAMQDGFYFAATTYKAGSFDKVGLTWMGGLETDTFVAYLVNDLVKLPEVQIEAIRKVAGARALRSSSEKCENSRSLATTLWLRH